jgi:queuine/archaeosine tRNA-ribosyltransferase
MAATLATGHNLHYMAWVMASQRAAILNDEL